VQLNLMIKYSESFPLLGVRCSQSGMWYVWYILFKCKRTT